MNKQPSNSIRVQLFDLVSLFFVSDPIKFRFCYFHCRPLDCKLSSSMSFLTALFLAFSPTCIFVLLEEKEKIL
jgi:hypothetical protein